MSLLKKAMLARCSSFLCMHTVAEWWNTLTNGFFVLSALACYPLAYHGRLSFLYWYFTTMLLMTGEGGPPCLMGEEGYSNSSA